MKILELLKGKKMSVKTDVGVNVELEIKSVEEKFNSINVEPSDASNDWWPAQKTWTNYIINFTNGYSKTYSSLNEIEIY